ESTGSEAAWRWTSRRRTSTPMGAPSRRSPSSSGTSSRNRARGWSSSTGRASRAPRPTSPWSRTSSFSWSRRSKPDGPGSSRRPEEPRGASWRSRARWTSRWNASATHPPSRTGNALREAYHRAGVPEYWLIDARKEPIDFQVLVHRQSGYVQTPAGADGFIYSAVLGREVRLSVHRKAAGLVFYRLE